MRTMFNTMFSFLTSLFKGADEYAKAFESSGRMANKAMQTYEAEVQAELNKKLNALDLDSNIAELPQSKSA